jgi:hypothetical protein
VYASYETDILQFMVHRYHSLLKERRRLGMRKRVVIALVLVSAMLFAASAWAGEALIWGVAPSKTEGELININPWTGAITKSYDLSSTMINSTNKDIGLAGWTNALYYTNANIANGMIYTINPATGATVSSYTVSGGWEINGLGYWSSGANSYIYTSGCSVNDVHRYNATDGASPVYYWSTVTGPTSMAGDNGGKIFTYAGGKVYELDPLNDIAPLSSFDFLKPTGGAYDIVGMAFDGTYLYLSDTEGFMYIMQNGQLVKTTDLGYSLYALASTEGVPVGTPEPLSLLLVGAGLLGLGIVRKSL